MWRRTGRKWDMSALTGMSEGIRANGGREATALSQNKRENQSDTWKYVTPQPKEVKGRSNKVTGCHTKMVTIHAAPGLRRRVKANSSIKADSVARDKKGNADSELEAFSYRSCQGSVDIVVVVVAVQ